mmetsp:Transcript_58933/g.164674  ORF Transcript_58933/g.164674 Transcript_58933/m.164674 type:complete len:213 (-) Transcript_58933:567-1205(-)
MRPLPVGARAPRDRKDNEWRLHLWQSGKQSDTIGKLTAVRLKRDGELALTDFADGRLERVVAPIGPHVLYSVPHAQPTLEATKVHALNTPFAKAWRQDQRVLVVVHLLERLAVGGNIRQQTRSCFLMELAHGGKPERIGVRRMFSRTFLLPTLHAGILLSPSAQLLLQRGLRARKANSAYARLVPCVRRRLAQWHHADILGGRIIRQLRRTF